MRKIFCFLFALTMTSFSLSSNGVYAARVNLTYEDPNYNQDNPQRNPIQIPEVDLYGHTLTFYTSCLGSTLRLVNAENEVIYTTVITSDTLVLPSTLEGEYEIQIIQGQWCFYGLIEL